MKKRTFALLLAIFFATLSFAQNVDDYRSVQSGEWSDIATWEFFDGSSWQPASTIPVTHHVTITIRASHTVHVDVDASLLPVASYVIETGATLTGDITLDYFNNPLSGPAIFRVDGTAESISVLGYRNRLEIYGNGTIGSLLVNLVNIPFQGYVSINPFTFNDNLKISNSCSIGAGANQIIINGTLTILAGASFSVEGVITNGRLKKYISSGGSEEYPFGILYSTGSSGNQKLKMPVSIEISPSSMSDYFSVEISGPPNSSYDVNDISTGTELYENAVLKTWLIKEDVQEGTNANLTVKWQPGDEGGGFVRNQARISHYVGGQWDFPSSPSTVITTTSGTRTICTISRNGVTSFSPFAVSSSLITAPLTTYYRDLDGDSYGDPNNTQEAESQPPGYVLHNTDCNDNDAVINPGATEICGNGIDENCNGMTDDVCTTVQIVHPNRSFEGCGSFTTTFANNGTPLIRHTLIKPNGKILSGGHSSETYNTLFAQYNSNGSPDPGFGVNGQSVISFNTRTICESFALQSDGKIVGVGTDAPDNSGSLHIPLIFRLNEDGTVDNSFGVDGKRALRFDNVSSGGFNKVVVLPDGKILAAGDSRGNINGGVAGPGMMKFNADGSLDSSFGNMPGFPGRSRIPLNYTGNVNLIVQSDGKIILAYSRDVTGNSSPVTLEIVRFLSDGTVDNGFGTLEANGINMEGILSSAVQPDGKIIFSCTSNNEFNPGMPTKIIVLRYLPDFTPDAAFGNAGIVELDNLDGSGLSFYNTNIGLQPDGKILISGGTSSPMVIRLTADGQLDTDFNGTGFYFTPTYTNPSLIEISVVDNYTFIVSSPNYRITSITTISQPPSPFSTFYLDADNDGFGNAEVSTQSCATPPGYVSNSADCDDSQLLYADTDGDGYGAGVPVACGVNNNTDCNDNETTAYPGGTEICGNGIDENCNGMTDDICVVSLMVDLNRSFEGCGTFITAFAENGTPNIRHTLIKPDGKILSGGHSDVTYNTLIAQYNSDGSPDAVFGVIGQAVISLNTRTFCEALGLQPDGKIIGVGTDAPDNSGSLHIPLIFRLNENGTVDNSFGVDGKMALRFDDVSSGGFTQVIVLPDGKILAAGDSRGNINGGIAGPGMMKFNADGSLDNSFGNIPGFPGRARIPLNYTGHVNMFVQNDGKIILAYSRDVTGNSSPVNLEIVRFLSDGTVDNSFGTDGTLVANGINMEGILSSAVQPDGKIIFACTSNNEFNPGTPTKIIVLRYLPDFTPDAAFGNAGIVELDNLDGSGLSFYNTNTGLQPDGKILLSGGRSSGYPDNSPMVIRLNADGQLEAVYNNGGYYFVPASITTQSLADIIAVDNNTCIVSSADNYRLLSLTTNAQDPLSTFYRDEDSDGFGNAAVTTQACTVPSGYVNNSTDCDDNNNAVHPGAAEVCNGIDDNCDGQTDEGGQSTFYQDSDGDGYGNPEVTTQACAAPEGYISNSTDCNDTNAAVHPGAAETCNGFDDDCDGLIDEGVTTTFYLDADGDGFGNAAITIQACTVPSGYIANNTDCNDNNASIHPGAIEICGNTVDEDCDGLINESCPNGNPPKINVNNITITEGNIGTTNAVFVVRLSKTSTATISVQYQTADSTAISGQDYSQRSGTLVFPPNTTTLNVTVPVTGDLLDEFDEFFTLRLSNGINATINDFSARARINDDDAEPGLRINDTTAAENSIQAIVRVNLTAPSSKTIQVQYNTKDRTAKSPQDFTEISSGSLTFLPGESVKYITVNLVYDALNEPSEFFELKLKQAVNATLGAGTGGRNSADITILNSQPPTTRIRANDSGNKQAEETVKKQPVEKEEKQISSPVLYPNPADQQATLKLSNEFAQGKISIHLIDRNGSIVKRSEYINNMKGQNIMLNTASLASGMYFIIITDSKGKQVTEKLMIQH